MSVLKIPTNTTVKSRRIPNAFMLFVKEQKKDLLKKCPEENKSVLGAYLGRKWRSLTPEEKQVYYDKYKALKKLEKDNADLSSITDEKLLEEESIQRNVINEISMDVTSTAVGMDIDQESCKSAKKRNAEDSFSSDRYLYKEYQNDPIRCSPSNDDTPLSSLVKQKAFKKVRRPPNAFMLFAREQRCNLDSSYIKDNKKNHVSTILGNMWRDLPHTEKEKYYHEAKKLFNLHKKPETQSSTKVSKKKTKSEFKKISKKTVGRPSKKKREAISYAPLRNLRSHEADSIGDKETQAEFTSIKPSDKVESNGNVNVSSEPQISHDYSNTSYLHQHNSVVSHFHRMPSSIEPHHSTFCNCRSSSAADYSNNDIMRRYSTPEGSLSRSCFGAGFLPPLFPSYPFNTSPFWMYQQAMAQQMFSFPSLGFSQSNCSCNLTYPYNNAYFSAYSGLYSGRCSGAFSYATHPNSSATAISTSTREESVEVPKSNNHSDDEFLVVDEGSTDGQQRNQNGSAPE